MASVTRPISLKIPGFVTWILKHTSQSTNTNTWNVNSLNMSLDVNGFSRIIKRSDFRPWRLFDAHGARSSMEFRTFQPCASSNIDFYSELQCILSVVHVIVFTSIFRHIKVQFMEFCNNNGTHCNSSTSSIITNSATCFVSTSTDK